MLRAFLIIFLLWTISDINTNLANINKAIIDTNKKLGGIEDRIYYIGKKLADILESIKSNNEGLVRLADSINKSNNEELKKIVQYLEILTKGYCYIGES